MSDLIYHLPPVERGPEFAALSAAPENWGMAACFVDALRAIGGDGEGITVAVLDTGIDAAHPEFPRLVATKSFIAGEGVRDGNGHGTHCAATAVGASPGVGVANKAGLLVGKVLSNGGTGSTSGINAGIRWATEAGANVISMSLGGGGADPDQERAIREAEAKGVIVLAASGNSRPSRTEYPGRYCLAVAACDQTGRVASFSSPGQTPDTLVCCAPGVNIVSARPGGGYQSMSGTCIAEGEYVYTPTGPKRIETIEAGETVYAQKDGKVVERVVYGVHDRGTAEVHKLSAGGRDVMATASHEMFVYDTKTKEPDWVRLGQLTDRHRLIVTRGLSSQVNPYLDALLSSDFCWLAGFFTGDGWISHTTGGMRTAFAVKKNPETNAKVERLYNQIVGKQLRTNKNGNWNYDDCTRMAMVISAIGLNSPAEEKTVPLWVWALGREKQIAFYEGYRAADGHQIKAPERNGIADAFECSSADLVRRLSCLTDYIGWKRGAVRNRSRMLQAPNSAAPKETVSHQLNVYRTKITGMPRLDSEAAAAGIDTDQYALSPHTVMEKYSRRSKVYDLTVPDADCFITHGLVTHNSMATPFVAGVTAGAMSVFLKRGQKLPNSAWVKQFYRDWCIDAGTAGPDVDYGSGLVSCRALARYFDTPTMGG